MYASEEIPSQNSEAKNCHDLFMGKMRPGWRLWLKINMNPFIPKLVQILLIFEIKRRKLSELFAQFNSDRSIFAYCDKGLSYYLNLIYFPNPADILIRKFEKTTNFSEKISVR